MPLYEYECLKCGERFEQIQKFSDAPVTEHPDCGGDVRKLLSAPAIQFKGSGWYVTDYARAGQQGKSESDDKKAEAKAEAKAEGKAEAKGETTKTESKPESKKSAESTKSTSDSSKK